MTELVAWAAFPLLMLLPCLGVGLLAERAAGTPLPAALVPPLGLCGSIVLIGPFYAAGAGAGTAIAVLAVATAAGLWLSRTELRARFRPGAGAVAGGCAYALHMAPVVLSGDATFLGYNLLGDTAAHFVLVDYVSEFGRMEHALPASTFASTIDGYVDKSYPLGSHELLAALRAVFDVEVARIYQPFLAVSVALAASALVALLRRAGAPALAAAGAALLAVASQLFFSFDLQGGIKELMFVATLATAAAVGAELLRTERPVPLAGVLALPALAAYAIYGLAALAWLAPLVALLAGWAFAAPGAPLRRRLLPAAAAGIAVFALAGAPTLVASVEFYREGESTLTSQVELGPLIGPLRVAEAAGIWFEGDYRQLPDDPARTYLFIGGALALAALGAGLAARRREPGPFLFLLPSLVAFAVVAPGGSPYVDAKLLAVLSPGLLLFAALGVAALWRERTRVEAALAGAVLAGAVAYSDALAYRVALPAPMDRLTELEEIGERFAGEGPLLVNEFEEYAKHFARRARTFAPYDGLTPAPARLREPRPLHGFAYTLDELTTGFVLQYPLLALRRSPAESRPPAQYELAWRGRWYEVWRRPGPVVAVEHLPLGAPPVDPLSASSVPECRVLVRFAGRGVLTAALRPVPAYADLAASKPLPPAWSVTAPGTLQATKGGTVGGTARTQAGRHRVWIKGRFHRRSEIAVDGRAVGTVKHLNGPNQWIDAGVVELSAGEHRVELRRPRGSLAPGDGQADRIGPLALVPEVEERVVRIAPGRSRRLCGEALDWVERPARP